MCWLWVDGGEEEGRKEGRGIKESELALDLVSTDASLFGWRRDGLGAPRCLCLTLSSLEKDCRGESEVMWFEGKGRDLC